MDEQKPRRPWWRRKRWRPAVAFWLALPILYPLSIGPSAYCVGRRWIEDKPLTAFYRPLVYIAGRTGQADRLSGYVGMWYTWGWHAASD